MRGAAAELAAQQRLQRAAEVEQRRPLPARLGPLERALERVGRAARGRRATSSASASTTQPCDARTGCASARARRTTRRATSRAAAASPSASRSWPSTDRGGERAAVAVARAAGARPARARRARCAAPPRARAKLVAEHRQQRPVAQRPRGRSRATASALSSSPCRVERGARSSARNARSGGSCVPLSATRASSSVTAASSPRSQQELAPTRARGRRRRRASVRSQPRALGQRDRVVGQPVPTAAKSLVVAPSSGEMRDGDQHEPVAAGLGRGAAAPLEVVLGLLRRRRPTARRCRGAPARARAGRRRPAAPRRRPSAEQRAAELDERAVEIPRRRARCIRSAATETVKRLAALERHAAPRPLGVAEHLLGIGVVAAVQQRARDRERELGILLGPFDAAARSISGSQRADLAADQQVDPALAGQPRPRGPTPPPRPRGRRPRASSPWSANHDAARRCSAGTCVGSLAAQLGDAAARGTARDSGTTRRAGPAARAARPARERAEPRVPVAASR